MIFETMDKQKSEEILAIARARQMVGRQYQMYQSDRKGTNGAKAPRGYRTASPIGRPAGYRI